MSWLARLTAWWGRRRVSAMKEWPKDRTPGAPRFAPTRAERLAPGDPLDVADERIERLDWRIRELEREQALDRERFGRGRRP